MFSSLEFGRGLFDCQLDSEQLGVAAVAALSASRAAPPPLLSPQPQSGVFDFSRWGKPGWWGVGEQVEKSQPPTPPKLVHTLTVKGGKNAPNSRIPVISRLLKAGLVPLN